MLRIRQTLTVTQRFPDGTFRHKRQIVDYLPQSTVKATARYAVAQRVADDSNKIAGWNARSSLYLMP